MSMYIFLSQKLDKDLWRSNFKKFHLEKCLISNVDTKIYQYV